LTIRAAPGFTPVIKAQKTGIDALFQVKAKGRPGPGSRFVGLLTLEGLMISGGNIALGAEVRAANCDFDPGHVAVSGRGSFRNCRFAAAPGQYSLGFNSLPPASPQQSDIENCIFPGPWGVVVVGASPLSIRQCTLAGAVGIELRVTLALGKPKSAPQPQRVVLENNVFACTNVCKVNYVGPAGGGLPDGVRKLWEWTEKGNLYKNEALFLQMAPQFKASADAKYDLTAWHKFWKIANTGSIHDAIRLTPDFRLEKGSPGHGILTGGKDLGANVDLVGPGTAYDNWRVTDEYRQWLASRAK
jgi:hypothetical protein